MRVKFKVASVTLIPTIVWQGVPLILILVSLKLLVGIIGIGLQKDPSNFHQLWERLIWGLFFRGRYEGIQLCIN